MKNLNYEPIDDLINVTRHAGNGIVEKSSLEAQIYNIERNNNFL